MRNIFDDVLCKINEFRTPCCIGLDPDLKYIPDSLKGIALANHGNTRKGVASAFFEFNKAIIDATADIVGIYKPQMAFYEKYGPDGIQAFMDTVSYLKRKGKIVIEDAKRNDVGNTAAAYADSHLGVVDLFTTAEPVYNVDLLTVNGYLGSDGIKPFVESAQKHSKGLFVLSKTSNPSSVEFQDIAHGEYGINYMLMMDLIRKCAAETKGASGYMVAGAVVGTTFPSDASVIRKKFPDCFFLVPGFGAQGGKADDVASCFNSNGEGAIISSSRQITYAYLQAGYTVYDFAEAARNAAIQMVKEISAVL